MFNVKAVINQYNTLLLLKNLFYQFHEIYYINKTKTKVLEVKAESQIFKCNMKEYASYCYE